MSNQQVWDGSLCDFLPPNVTSVAGVNTFIFPEYMSEFVIVNTSGGTINLAYDGEEVLTIATHVGGVVTLTRSRVRRATVTTADWVIPNNTSFARKVRFKTLYLYMAAGVHINDFTDPATGVFLLVGRGGVAEGM